MKKSKELLSMRLLPKKCKIWGVVISALSILPAITFHARGIHLSENGKEMLKVITFGIFTIGLCLIVWAKDKIEDELTTLIRLRAMAFSFGFIVFFAVFQPFVNALFMRSITEISSYQ